MAKDSFLAVQYARFMIRRGKSRSKMTAAYSQLITIYYIMRDRVSFRDIGEDYYNRFNDES